VGGLAVTEPARDEHFEQADQHLRKTMSGQQLLFLSVGGIIGSGWLFAVLAAAGYAGPASLISWVVGGIFIIFIAINYAEISGMLPRSGGIVRYPQLTHGAYTAWILGWAYWLSAVTTVALEAESVITYLGGKFPGVDLVNSSGILLWPNGILCGTGLVLFFLVLNFFGIRLLSEWNRWVTWWKLIIPTATFCFLFAVFHASNLTAHGGFQPLGTSSIFQALVLSGIIFAYGGFRQALDYGGECRNPQRDIPFATIGSIVIAMVIYILLQLAFLGVMKWTSIGVHAGDWSALLGSNNWKDGPLYHALVASGVGALGSYATLLLVDSAISPSGTGWIYFGTSTRTIYGMGIGRLLPRLFTRMNRFGIPWPALVATFVVACIFFVPSPSWYSLVSFSTSASVLTYIMGGLSLPVLRKTAAGLNRPFRLWWHHLWAPLGFLAAFMVYYWSGFTTLNDVYAAVLIALPIYAWIKSVEREWVKPAIGAVIGLVFLGAWIYINVMGGWTMRPSGIQAAGSWSFPVYDIALSAAVLFFCVALWAASTAEGRHHIVRTAWLIWMLLATLPVSYYGEYGPLAHPLLVFPYGTLVEVGVGIITYYWGVSSGFLTEEVKEIIAVHQARQVQHGEARPPAAG
jgi:amino acid transporter